MSDEAVKEATGRDWDGWRRLLDDAGAADMPHAEIAKMLSANGVKPWWRQMVTVGYERMIGRREVGQTCAGDFSASVSRTVTGDMDQMMARWSRLNEERTEFVNVLAASQPRVTQTENWRYWRVDLEDGSRVSVHFSDKAGGKAAIGVNHDKLSDAARVAESKAWWKPLLGEL